VSDRDQTLDSTRPRHAPTILLGQDGEPPLYVNGLCAATPQEAVAFARDQGEDVDEGIVVADQVTRVLMRELDEIACKIRGVERPWWVECSARSKKAVAFWRIDD
jgi:hypothetical protein